MRWTAPLSSPLRTRIARPQTSRCQLHDIRLEAASRDGYPDRSSTIQNVPPSKDLAPTLTLSLATMSYKSNYEPYVSLQVTFTAPFRLLTIFRQAKVSI
jgi:hypothetical protein